MSTVGRGMCISLIRENGWNLRAPPLYDTIEPDRRG